MFLIGALPVYAFLRYGLFSPIVFLVILWVLHLADLLRTESFTIVFINIYFWLPIGTGIALVALIEWGFRAILPTVPLTNQ